MRAKTFVQRVGTGTAWTGIGNLEQGAGNASCAVSGEGVTAILEAKKFSATPLLTFRKVAFRIIGQQPAGSNDSEYFLVPSGSQLSSEGGGVFSALVKDEPVLTKQHVESEDFGIAWAGYAANGGTFTLDRVELEIS